MITTHNYSLRKRKQPSENTPTKGSALVVPALKAINSNLQTLEEIRSQRPSNNTSKELRVFTLQSIRQSREITDKLIKTNSTQNLFREDDEVKKNIIDLNNEIIEKIQRLKISVEEEIKATPPVHLHAPIPRPASAPPSLTTEDPRRTPYDSRGFESHQHQAEGPINPVEAREVLDRLKETLPVRTICNNTPFPASLEGGADQAMCLALIDTYHRLKEESAQSVLYKEEVSRRLWREGKNYAVCTEEMRNRQAAYNKIEPIDSHNLSTSQLSEQLIQATAYDYQLLVASSSKKISSFNVGWQLDLIYAMTLLPDGAHLIRMNNIFDDVKHHLVYIREKGVSYLFDPNRGLMNLDSLDHSIETLKIVNIYKEEYHLNFTQFFHIIPESEAGSSEFFDYVRNDGSK